MLSKLSPFQSLLTSLVRNCPSSCLSFLTLCPASHSGTERCNKGTYIKSSTAVPDHISFNCLNATTEEIAQQGRSGIISTIKHFVIEVFADYNRTFNSSVPLMHVRMGLTDNTAAVIRQTRPAILGEHQNMVGEGEVIVRRELTTPGFATLGVFSVRCPIPVFYCLNFFIELEHISTHRHQSIFQRP